MALIYFCIAVYLLMCINHIESCLSDIATQLGKIAHILEAERGRIRHD